MRPVSNAFRTAVVANHRLATRVEVLKAGDVIATLDTKIGGTVTLDAAAAVRGRCDLTVVDDGTQDLMPSDPGDLLAPYGNELRIYRGLTYPDGLSELVSLGVFRIENVDVQSSSADRTIQITGQDRAAIIADARFEQPYQVAAGTNVATAISSTILAVYPVTLAQFATTSAVTPLLIAEEGEDRWQFCTNLARSAGLRLYFNGDGALTLAPEVTTGDPVVTLAEGEDGVLVKAGRKWGRASAFNRVIATGENTGETAPARGVATDDNPASPTYYYGTFGRVPRFYSSSFLATDEQAADAAAAILARETGTTQSVECGAIVLPHLEPGDIARITRHQIRVNENHVLDSLSIPLAADGELVCGTRAIVGQAYEPPATGEVTEPLPGDAPLYADTSLASTTALSSVGVAA